MYCFLSLKIRKCVFMHHDCVQMAILNLQMISINDKRKMSNICKYLSLRFSVRFWLYLYLCCSYRKVENKSVKQPLTPSLFPDFSVILNIMDNAVRKWCTTSGFSLNSSGFFGFHLVNMGLHYLLRPHTQVGYSHVNPYFLIMFILFIRRTLSFLEMNLELLSFTWISFNLNSQVFSADCDQKGCVIKCLKATVILNKTTDNAKINHVFKGTNKSISYFKPFTCICSFLNAWCWIMKHWTFSV